MKKKWLYLGLVLFAYLGLLLFIDAIAYADTGDESITLTSFVDRRNIEPLVKPVWELVITSTHDADDTGDVTLAVPINGILQKIVFVIPNFTNGITGQVKILDNGDNTIFDSGELAKALPYTFNTSEPLSGTIDVVIGVSGASGGTADSNDMIVTLRGI